MTVSETLQEWRRRSGKSQQCIADFCGISQAAYSRYERGEREMPLWLLCVIACVAGVTDGDVWALVLRMKVDAQQKLEDLAA